VQPTNQIKSPVGANGNGQMTPTDWARTLVHGSGARFLASIAGEAFGANVPPAAFKIYCDHMLRGCTDDPMELTLREQLLWMHYRMGSLLAAATEATDVRVAERYDAAAAKLAAECRRTTMALREYLQPPTPPQVTVVKQQNVSSGEQQVAYVEAGAQPVKRTSDTQQVSKQPQVRDEQLRPAFPESPKSSRRPTEPAVTRPIVRNGQAAAARGGPG